MIQVLNILLASKMIKSLDLYVLPQMNGYIKDFDNGGKNMSLKIEGDSVLVKYNDVWNKIKEVKRIKFHNNPVYDEKYIKAKVKEFHGELFG